MINGVKKDFIPLVSAFFRNAKAFLILVPWYLNMVRLLDFAAALARMLGTGGCIAWNFLISDKVFVTI
jgi:hypothetical protein